MNNFFRNLGFSGIFIFVLVRIIEHFLPGIIADFMRGFLEGFSFTFVIVFLTFSAIQFYKKRTGVHTRNEHGR